MVLAQAAVDEAWQCKNKGGTDGVYDQRRRRGRVFMLRPVHVELGCPTSFAGATRNFGEFDGTNISLFCRDRQATFSWSDSLFRSMRGP